MLCLVIQRHVFVWCYQFFDSLIRHLGVVIFQVVFNANELLFDPFFFRFFQDVSDLSVHLLYISLPSVSPFFFFSSLLLSHRSRMSEVTLFYATVFAKDLVGCFCYCYVH